MSFYFSQFLISPKNYIYVPQAFIKPFAKGINLLLRHGHIILRGRESSYSKFFLSHLKLFLNRVQRLNFFLQRRKFFSNSQQTMVRITCKQESISLVIADFCGLLTPFLRAEIPIILKIRQAALIFFLRSAFMHSAQ